MDVKNVHKPSALLWSHELLLTTKYIVFIVRYSTGTNVVTVVAIHTDHRVSTYRLPALVEALTEHSTQLGHQSRPGSPGRDGAAAPGRRKEPSRAEPAKDSSELEGRNMIVYLFHLSKTCLNPSPARVLQRRRCCDPRWFVERI